MFNGIENEYVCTACTLPVSLACCVIYHLTFAGLNGAQSICAYFYLEFIYTIFSTLKQNERKRGVCNIARVYCCCDGQNNIVRHVYPVRVRIVFF